MDIPPMPTRSKIIGIIFIIIFLLSFVLQIYDLFQEKKERERRRQLFMSLPGPQYDSQQMKQDVAKLLNMPGFLPDSTSDADQNSDQSGDQNSDN